MTFEARLGRTSIVIAVIAMILGAYIGLYERGTLSTGELAGRRGRLLTHFVRDRVDQVVIEREEGRVVLEREPAEDGEDGELGEWRLVEPVRGPADVDAVDTLLGALEWANARRTLEDLSAEDRTRFGFDEPSLSASFRVAGEGVPLTFGGEDALESGLYLTLDDATTAYVVGQDLFEALDHDANHFRDRALLSRFGTSGATVLTVDDDGGERRIEKRDGRFHLEAPVRGYASEGRVRDMLRALGNIEATRFIAEGDGTDGDYGLDSPTRTVRISKEGSEAGTGAAAVEVRFGGPCADHAGEVYARVDEGPVVCINAESLAPLALTPAELREPRLVSTDDEELVRLTIEQGGRTLVVARGEDFNFTLGEGDDAVPVDEGALADFMRDLRSVRATAFPERTGDPVPDPWLVLSLVGDDEERVEEIRVGPPSATGLVAVRGDEPVYLTLTPEAEAVLTVTSLRFRDRRLIDEDVDEAVRLELINALGTQVVARDGVNWSLEAPVAAPAERSVLRDAVRELSTLEAVRFEAEVATAAHGLDTPRVTATLRFERSDAAEDDHDHGHDHGDEDGADEERAETREYTLRIGAAAEDGAFARLGNDEAVFVVTQAVADALGASLVGRGIMSTELDVLSGITVERDGATTELTKADDGWHTADGGSPDAERTRDLADRVAVIRATQVVGYGAAARAAAGTGAPRARVTVVRTASAPAPTQYTIAVGPELTLAGEGAAVAAPSVYVWREDLDATFIVPAVAVEAFLTYSP